MDVKNVDIDIVIPYDNNPRNNDDAVQATANSIKEFGWQQPIVVDKDNIVIVGHTRLKAAYLLGLKEVPIVVADKLSDEQVKAYRLADNKTGELADWDNKELEEELNKILDIDMEDFGFEPIEEEVEELEEEPEVPFTQELLEENNYIVLKFDNSVDWLQAQTVFNLQTVKALHSKPGFESKGQGRVIDGAKAIQKLIEGDLDEDIS